MNVEAQLVLDSFKLRPYQAPIQDALKNGKRRIIAILPRRAGKDLACWNILIREAWKKPGIYWMIYPTYSMARKILWDGLTNDGKSFLSFIPKEFVKQIYQQEMKVRLLNESVIQLQGSDSPDRLVGANCYGAVFSEYALQDPIVYQQIVRPMLTANNGFAIFISTPRGKANHLWELWNIAQSNQDHWFSYLMTILQTGHISVAEIQRLIDSGEMEESLAKQEFYCDFSRGVEGSFYGAFLDKARLQGRIGHVPHEPGLLVYTAFDIGVRDATTIIWYQIAGQTVRILGCYSNHSVGLDHYVEKLDSEQKKWGYKYGKHFAPHDIKVREWGAGAITRYEQARQLGITFTLLEQIGLSEGINNVWMNFNKLYFDEVNCKTLIDALENYRREWDEQKKVHSNKPLHNWASNYSDSLRYLVQSLPLCNFRSTTPQDLENRFKQAKYGGMNEPSFKSERY
jgi:hypothetical protein